MLKTLYHSFSYLPVEVGTITLHADAEASAQWGECLALDQIMVLCG